MAGRVKHMERSHRSYRNRALNGIYNDFNRRAYSIKVFKENKKTVGQRFSDLFRKMLPKTAAK